MLTLLSVNQAVLFVLHWYKKLDDPYDPEALGKCLEDTNLRKDHLLFQMFLQNAIAAGELPSLRKPKSKPEEKKILQSIGLPEELQAAFPKIYDYWVTWDDLVTFFQRPNQILDDSYAHSRDAVARVAWLLVQQSGLGSEFNALFEKIEQLVTDWNEKEGDCQLGDTTLKGCVREILDAGKKLSNEK